MERSRAYPGAQRCSVGKLRKTETRMWSETDSSSRFKQKERHRDSRGRSNTETQEREILSQEQKGLRRQVFATKPTERWPWVISTA